MYVVRIVAAICFNFLNKKSFVSFNYAQLCDDYSKSQKYEIIIASGPVITRGNQSQYYQKLSYFAH